MMDTGIIKKIEEPTEWVQESSDCCINSKFSAAQKGYFQDDYLSLFAKKLHPRSPIINRGYYIRFKAMEEVFQSCLSSVNLCTYHKFQIISLGAGYDSSYIRLKSNNQLPPQCHYIEVDFPEVMKRKYELIKDIVNTHKDDDRSSWQDPAIVLCTGEYTLLGTDLTDIPVFQKCLGLIGIDYSTPTLFLSECSITYIDPNSSENFILWVQKQFPNSAFAAYEQVYPKDAFGLVMQNHFNQVGCSLKSITKYPNEESQCERFKKLHWSSCSVITMYDLFNSLSIEEKHRIEQLEMFDEYEMWHEKCHHYTLLWASQGVLSKCSPSFLTSKNAVEPNIIAKRILNWKFVSSEDVAQRYGHQMIAVSSSVVILSGGFGRVDKKHQRLGDIVLYDIELKKHHKMTLIEKNLMGKRMFHSMTKLSNNTIVVLGGRSSPKKVFEEILILSNSNLQENAIIWDSSDSSPPISVSVVTSTYKMPVPTWRHSACLVDIKGTEYIVVFGGCSQNCVATNGCFILNTLTWQWSNINTQEHTPCARHSHSAVTYDKSHIIVTGGLTEDETILQSVYILNCNSLEWSIMPVSGLLPRYSHTSHVWKNHLFLVGGITSVARYKLGIGLVNLDTLQALETLAPGQDPEYPILLSNHSSFLYEDEILIVGGGGNCFSFGTHFNKKIVRLDLKQV